MLAALADGPSTLTGLLDARDTQLMRDALTGLGVAITDLSEGVVRVDPPDRFRPTDVKVGLAGTVMRFVPPLAALADGASRFEGDAEATARPIGPLLHGLRQAGVDIEHPESLPFTVRGAGRVAGGPVSIDSSGSSQFVSGLLMAGARFDRGLELRHNGATLPSRPHIALTVAMLRDRGVHISEQHPDRWIVSPGPISSSAFAAMARFLGTSSATRAWRSVS